MPNLNPSFLVPPGHIGNAQDSRRVVLLKVLGILIDIYDPMNTSPTFLVPPGHTPNAQDSELTILQKILGALTDIESGGGGGGGGGSAGIGSPEGVVSGSPGASYLDVTDPLVPIEWKKTSGTNTTTGWILFAG